MIVLTTPTGDIGGQLLRLLLDRAPDHGEALRVVVRDPARLPGDVRERVDVVVGSHGDADVLDRAFSGADAVFWCVPPDPSTPDLESAFAGFTRPAVDALRAHGVGHVVGVSALGRGTAVADSAGFVTASLRMDDVLAGSGAAYRALANPSFMDNLLRQVASIRDAGVFTDTAIPDRRAPTAATRDIAAAAATLLLDRSWTGVGEVPVLGPEDLSQEELAATVSDVLGTPVRYERRSLDDLAASMRGFGAGEAFATGMVEMMRAKDEGLDAGVARTPETSSPTTFRQWCTEVLLPAVRGADGAVAA
ncbi:NAD(P)H-binding protein [Patulibacter sp.]|uniref:NAD(P)H-binding protein n=1 Tax=Patulibacter sp. TaxID=1912859 RepID=UPI00271DFB69|nr:NAD(P)H-binding protein [Patulibacter sp.]MDO9409062.1 NAD(P)H-binding protein [Patulibacter sp.]